MATTTPAPKTAKKAAAAKGPRAVGVKAPTKAPKEGKAPKEAKKVKAAKEAKKVKATKATTPAKESNVTKPAKVSNATEATEATEATKATKEKDPLAALRKAYAPAPDAQGDDVKVIAVVRRQSIRTNSDGITTTYSMDYEVLSDGRVRGKMDVRQTATDGKVLREDTLPLSQENIAQAIAMTR